MCDELVQWGLGINEEALYLDQLRLAEGPRNEYGGHVENHVPVEVDLRRRSNTHRATASEGAQALQYLLTGSGIARGLLGGAGSQSAGKFKGFLRRDPAVQQFEDLQTDRPGRCRVARVKGRAVTPAQVPQPHGNKREG